MASLSRSLLFARPKSLSLAVAVALIGGGSLEAFAAPEPERVFGHSLSELDLPVPDKPDPSKRNEQTLYLEVYFDDRPAGLIAQLRLRNGRLYSTPDELRALGLVVGPDLTVDNTGLIALDALPGLTYRYEIEKQYLVLTVPVALRPQQRLGYRTPGPVAATRSHGLLLNYDAFARSVDGTDSLVVATALRWFGRAGALELTGVSRAGDDAAAYDRLDTHWTYSDPQRLWTWTAGDLINGSLSWSRPVRLGGLQWRRNFGMRPDLITFPMPRFSGAATVPSAVELLVNNVQQYGAEVNDGPFIIDAFPRISGAGDVTLVVRDALGRSTQTTVPIYVDYQRLAPGLTDFSFELGVPRQGFGGDEDGYGNDLVASGSWRHGLTDDFTFEAHVEAGPGLRLAGLGGVWSPVGRWGLVTASIARSAGSTAGHQHAYGYQWTGQRFGLDFQSQRRSAGFRDIGNVVADDANNLSAQDRASFWLPLPRASLAFTWLRFLQSDGNQDCIRSLSWSQTLNSRLSLSASAFSSSSSGRGASLNFSLSLGHDLNANLSLDHSADQTQTVASLSRNPGYNGDWGWQMQAGDRRGGFAQASAKRRGRLGEVWFGVDQAQDRTGYFFQGTGSVVWMDGQAFASRRINDAFAVVSSDGIADVPVLYENRAYGHTDARGYLLLPDLRGWQRNRIAIDPDTLGANYRIPELQQWVTPADNAAVFVRFPIALVHPAMASLLGPTGESVPIGSGGKVLGGEETFLVGFDGEAYLENLHSGTVLELDVAGTLCRYHLPTVPVGPTDAALVRLGPLMCEVQP